MFLSHCHHAYQHQTFSSFGEEGLWVCHRDFESEGCPLVTVQMGLSKSSLLVWEVNNALMTSMLMPLLKGTHQSSGTSWRVNVDLLLRWWAVPPRMLMSVLQDWSGFHEGPKHWGSVIFCRWYFPLSAVPLGVVPTPASLLSLCGHSDFKLTPCLSDPNFKSLRGSSSGSSCYPGQYDMLA